jgi:putative ABC transport system permease protein
MVPLGRKTLFEDLPRFLVAQAGVAFAVALIAIETGIFFGFLKSAVLPIENSSADVWVAAKEMLYYELTTPISYDKLKKARSVPGVERAEAVLLKTSAWRGPDHKIELIRIVGFDPGGTLFALGPVSDEARKKLRGDDTAIVDAGKLDALNIAGVGGHGKVGQRSVRIVGLTRGTQPIVSATFIYASLRNAKAFLAPPMPPIALFFAGFRLVQLPPKTAPPKPDPGTLDPGDDISYILVKARPGTDLGALKTRLETALAGTRSFTKAEMAKRTDTYWVNRTGIGFILGVAALVGLIVGMAAVGQILYTSVAEHIKEYGTLRAMGAPDSLFYGVIAEQALLMALLGFVPGIILSYLVAAWSQAHREILILVTPTSAALTLAGIILMCTASGVFAVQRALRVDPAIVFKA